MHCVIDIIFFKIPNVLSLSSVLYFFDPQIKDDLWLFMSQFKSNYCASDDDYYLQFPLLESLLVVLHVRQAQVQWTAGPP